nr:hypothetical protein CFP56_05580 [Quercus suber]
MWTPLPKHWYKFSFDGATFVDKDTASIGIVVRNSDDLILVSLVQQIPLPSSVIEVKTLATRWALDFALELGFERIILEVRF